MMNGSVAKQRGMSMPAILFWLVLGAFVVTFLLKVGPVYVADWSISAIMKEVSKTPDAAKDGKRGVRELVSRRLGINDIGQVSAGQFHIGDAPGGYLLGIDYEVRKHFLGNLDFVMDFEHDVLVPKQ